METITPTRKEDVRDPRGLAGWPQEKGRDGERTPMQWDATRNAGFSTAAQTWLPVEADYGTKNVATESADPNSLWSWYRALVQLKRENAAVHSGETVFLDHDAQHALVWVRRQAGGPGVPVPGVIVACNMSAEPVTLDVEMGEVIMRSSGAAPRSAKGRLVLAPFETVVGSLAGK
jgi:alpha-glucosidase